MGDPGVFAVHRGIFDHPMFAPEPYTEREAWLWMLSAAAWRPTRARVGKAIIDVARGQLAFATRFLATKWKWAHSRVVRFLKRLETDTMIRTLATRETTLITICNYDEYQFGRNTDETQSGTPTETEVKHNRNKEEESKNLRKEDSEAKASGKATDAEVFRFGRKVLGSGAGGVVTKLRKHCRYDDEAAMELLRQAHEKASPMEWVHGVLRGTENAKTPQHILFPSEIYANVL
jgi:hypothetical protein